MLIIIELFILYASVMHCSSSLLTYNDTQSTKHGPFLFILYTTVMHCSSSLLTYHTDTQSTKQKDTILVLVVCSFIALASLSLCFVPSAWLVSADSPMLATLKFLAQTRHRAVFLSLPRATQSLYFGDCSHRSLNRHGIFSFRFTTQQLN